MPQAAADPEIESLLWVTERQSYFQPLFPAELLVPAFRRELNAAAGVDSDSAQYRGAWEEGARELGIEDPEDSGNTGK